MDSFRSEGMMSPELFPIGFSLGVATTATILAFLLAIPLAKLRYHHRGPAWDLMDGLLLLPLALPPTVVGLVLISILGTQSPVGQAFRSVGLQILFNWPAAIIAATTVSFPLMYQTARSSFRQIDPELLDTAEIHGVSSLQKVWFLMIPLAWPGIAAGLVLTFLRALGEFGATLMIAGNIPGKTQTAPVALFFAVEAGDMSYAWFLTWVILAASLLALLFSGLTNRWKDR